MRKHSSFIQLQTYPIMELEDGVTGHRALEIMFSIAIGSSLAPPVKLDMARPILPPLNHIVERTVWKRKWSNNTVYTWIPVWVGSCGSYLCCQVYIREIPLYMVHGRKISTGDTSTEVGTNDLQRNYHTSISELLDLKIRDIHYFII